jgi:beta-xylosidase
MTATNPLLLSDFPDPDVIRVGEVYYMISTTMHFMPGAVILRSYDLANWEILTYVYETLDGTPAQRLEPGKSAYGQGMWAASLRYHAGTYYVCFVANDTGKTYLYRSESITGPWRKSLIEGFFHDSSILFDDDGRIYLVYGNREIFLTELNAEMTGAKPGGLHRLIVKDEPSRRLGYEGAHVYKIGGRYYVLFIHWLSDESRRRTEACFSADSLSGEFSGRDVLDDDMGFFNQGIAQGGIVDTPQGDWYAILFQDSGAVGRIPVLVPLRWEDGFPVLGVDGKAPRSFALKSGQAGRAYAPIVSSDDFKYLPDAEGRIRLKPVWQWNHEPKDALWSIDGERGELKLVTDRIAENVTRSINTLTQRSVYPRCRASVRVDASGLRDGDYAGLCALQGRYGMVAVTRRGKNLFIVMRANPGEPIYEMGKTLDLGPGVEYDCFPLAGDVAELRADFDFLDMKDEASFFCREGGEWKRIGPVHKLHFGLDHFVGCRFGLFLYSTQTAGGDARFSSFEYLIGP